VKTSGDTFLHLGRTHESDGQRGIIAVICHACTTTSKKLCELVISTQAIMAIADKKLFAYIRELHTTPHNATILSIKMVNKKNYIVLTIIGDNM